MSQSTNICINDEDRHDDDGKRHKEDKNRMIRMIRMRNIHDGDKNRYDKDEDDENCYDRINMRRVIILEIAMMRMRMALTRIRID